MSSEVARVYRDLLKAVVKHVGKEDHKSHFTDFVKHEFRNNSNSLDKINLARNYTYLLNSIHSHKVRLETKKHGLFHMYMIYSDLVGWLVVVSFVLVSHVDYVNLLLLQDLLFSYNIAVDRTEEMKRVLGKSAASVGLRLPEVYQP